MRICMISPLRGEGGVGEYTAELTDCLRHSGVVVFLFAQSRSHASASDYVRIAPWSSFRQPLDYFRGLVDVLRIRPRAVHVQFDTVFSTSRRTYGYGGFLGEGLVVFLLLLKVFGIKRVVTIHSAWPSDALHNRIRDILSAQNAIPMLRVLPRTRFLPHIITVVKLGVLAISRASDAIVVLSEENSLILSRYYRVDPRKISVIHQPVPRGPECDRSQSRVRLRLPDDKLVFVSIGETKPDKGYESILSAFGTLRSSYGNFLFVIAGSPHPIYGPPYLRKLNAQIEGDGLGAHVRFVNKYLSEIELHDLLCAADAIVLPYKISVGSSWVLTRALGCGKTIFASCAGVAGQEAKAHGAIMFDPADSASFLNSMRKWIYSDRPLSVTASVANDRNDPAYVARQHIMIYSA